MAPTLAPESIEAPNRRVRRVRGHDFAFSGTDPDTLTSAAADGTVRLWSLREQCQLAEIRINASLHCAATHPTTGHLLTADAAGPVLLRHTGDGARKDS